MQKLSSSVTTTSDYQRPSGIEILSVEGKIKTKTALATVFLIDPPEMAFNCNICKTNYHRYDALGQHLRRKHNLKLFPFVCPLLTVVSSLLPSVALVPTGSDVMEK